MKFALLALATAGVALAAATPAAAHPGRGHHYAYGHNKVCTRWHRGHCVAWQTRGWHNRMERREMRAERRAAYNVGYRFRPSYAWTPYDRLPQQYVTQYNLDPNRRYVYSNNYIYQVDPTTYAVQRVIDALTR
ncbi:hypothetical protein ABDK56_05165 [Sphingomonas sp. ASV193]|uniref:hypothetical protein n=1 Tax=Sphingomonas sp. ASV193 TaxID=3144405 RepID=UPI0032E87719